MRHSRRVPIFPVRELCQRPEVSEFSVSLALDRVDHSAFFIAQFSHPYMTTGKTVALTVWTFIGKVMALFYNTLSRFVKAFLPRSNCLLISWLQSPSAVILEPRKENWSLFPLFPLLFAMK